MTLKHIFQILVIASVIFFFNCSVNKRHYRKGYHVAWHTKSSIEKSHNSNNPKNVKEGERVNSYEDLETTTSLTMSKSLTSSIDNSLNFVLEKMYLKIPRITNDSCADIIVFRDGAELTVKIVEVYDGTIKYLPCNNLNGPLRVANGDKIFMVKYANGTKEVFKERASQPTKPTQNTVTQKPIEKKINVLAMISFICAILGFLVFPAIAAFIFGIIALNKIKSNPGLYSNAWMAKFGIIAGGVWLFLFLLTLY